MTTKIGVFDRKLSGQHFHNLSYGHTTSRKVSTGLWSSDSDFLTPQKTWKSAWFIHILHSLVRIPYWKSNDSTWTSQARRNFSRRRMTISNIMKAFFRQFPIKRTNSRGHTAIIEGPNLFYQKNSFHSPNKKTSFNRRPPSRVPARSAASWKF